MKLSNYRGEDIRKMLFKAAVLLAVLLGILFLGIRIGHKFIGEKVASVIKEVGKKKDEDALQKEKTAEGEENSNGQNAAAENEKEENGKEEEGEAEATESEEVLIHRYDYIVEDCTWTEAAERCRERGGYLATIESREEFDFIINELNGNALGEILFYLGSSRDAENNYYWRNADGAYEGTPLNGSGDNWCNSYWMQGEPSFYDGEIEENVLALFYFKNEARWVFNDVPENILEHLPYYSGKIGYICEYED